MIDGGRGHCCEGVVVAAGLGVGVTSNMMAIYICINIYIYEYFRFVAFTQSRMIIKMLRGILFIYLYVFQ